MEDVQVQPGVLSQFPRRLGQFQRYRSIYLTQSLAEHDRNVVRGRRWDTLLIAWRLQFLSQAGDGPTQLSERVSADHGVRIGTRI